MNTEYIKDLDTHLKCWFENNEIIKQWENNLIQYEKDLKQYNIDIEEYNELYTEKKEYVLYVDYNRRFKCPKV